MTFEEAQALKPGDLIRNNKTGYTFKVLRWIDDRDYGTYELIEMQREIMHYPFLLWLVDEAWVLLNSRGESDDTRLDS